MGLAVEARLTSSVILLFHRVIQEETPDKLALNIGDGWTRQIDVGITPGVGPDSAKRILVAPVDASEYEFPSINERELFMKAPFDLVSETLDELRK
jgi:hypothetical protein